MNYKGFQRAKPNSMAASLDSERDFRHRDTGTSSDVCLTPSARILVHRSGAPTSRQATTEQRKEQLTSQRTP